ncbi:MAG: HK97 family phage prohead protease [Muribaculaceae bacterium]|nr:HK97 family phage prohead protease [Muribaculaceae bacterium]
MGKEAIITSNGLNSYGSRVLTDGGDLRQYERNPVLLFMHNRAFSRENLPIGRMEGLRIDGDRLIGTPVFDLNDEFAKRIADKWENGFLRMLSAGIEIIETSSDASVMLPGQTRPTITKWKLVEVSVVDIGANDEALRLYDQAGAMLKLASGIDNEVLPLLKEREDNQLIIKTTMNKELLTLLGLQEGATDEQVLATVRGLKEKADKVEAMTLANITAIVDEAVTTKKITADKKDHFVNLGKAAGIDSLRETLSLMKPVQKPTEVIVERTENVEGKNDVTFAKLSEVPEAELPKMKEENPAEYARLYKAEYGVELK